ncbi:MAG: sigma-70 family RNA polymerase sigma factor [Candidatus Paceibacterota bacterium]
MPQNGVERYFDQIGDKNLLSREEEVELAKRIEQDDEEARKKLITHNLRLVIQIAKKYKHYPGADFLDLIQAGNIGLIKAVNKFDWRKGYKFSTYATWWIRQKIFRQFNNHGRTIRVPAHMNDAFRKVDEAKKSLAEEGKQITPENLADETDFSEEQIERIQKAIKRTISLDTSLGEEGKGTTKLDITERKRETRFEKEENRKYLREALDAALEECRKISDREERLLKLRFGVEDYQPRTLEETGKVFDISRERVRQIQNRTLDKLDKYFLDYPAKKGNILSLIES